VPDAAHGGRDLVVAHVEAHRDDLAEDGEEAGGGLVVGDARHRDGEDALGAEDVDLGGAAVAARAHDQPTVGGLSLVEYGVAHQRHACSCGRPAP
jgi:hypothetical protein